MYGTYFTKYVSRTHANKNIRARSLNSGSAGSAGFMGNGWNSSRFWKSQRTGGWLDLFFGQSQRTGGWLAKKIGWKSSGFLPADFGLISSVKKSSRCCYWILTHILLIIRSFKQLYNVYRLSRGRQRVGKLDGIQTGKLS